MAIATTTTGAGGILPQDWLGKLIIEPVSQASVALDPRVSTVVQTDSVSFHIPTITGDAGAAWVTEGATITPSDPTMAETIVVPSKLAGLVVISSELANDSSPAAGEMVAQSLARSLAAKLDLAYFGNVASPAPAGLGALSNSAVSRIIAGTAPTTLDSFLSAINAVQQDGAEITAWVAHPADALLFQGLKAGTALTSYLLGSDASNGVSAQILGLPLIVSKNVAAGNVYGVASSRSFVIMRRDVDVQISRDAYFSSDQLAVRATMRVGFAFPTPKAVARIALATS